MVKRNIVIQGARVHNLKNIDVMIPRDEMVVITGLSGSGKSSLAFDTIYAEGQRRYVESLSAYARQFLGQMDKPDVDVIEGLSPTISIDQKTTSRNPRSTVGTITEIYDYLRLLYARVGHAYCPKHTVRITSQTVQQMVDRIMNLKEGTRIQLLSPIIKGRKGEHVKVFEDIIKQGYVRVRVDGEVMELSDSITLVKNKKHTIEIVIDRIKVRKGIEMRLADSIETSLRLSDGEVIVAIIDGDEILCSQKNACPECGYSINELSPRMFSFNSPYGACSECDGLGSRMDIDTELMVPDPTLTLNQGALEPWASPTANYYQQLLRSFCQHVAIDMDIPFQNLLDSQKELLFFGKRERFLFTYVRESGSKRSAYTTFQGIVKMLTKRYRESSSEAVRQSIEVYMTTKPCSGCHGARLKADSLHVLVNNKTIDEIAHLSIQDALSFFESVTFTEKEMDIARQVLKEIKNRLGFLVNVGLGYLTLARAAATLSGGEAQRIRLATQIGSSLVGVLYILDEPSIGLHQRDNHRLISTLQQMRDLGNTLIVVEHDEDTMLAADYLIDIGPGAGALGGRVIAAGTPEEVMHNKESLTGQYLNGKRFIPVPLERKEPNGKYLEVIGASENNLQDMDISFPLGCFICVTGVSGSGKSTLINEIVQKALSKKLHRAKAIPGKYKEIRGMHYLDKLINIDQSPIGRTPRSNPATYTGVFDDIRDLFCSTPEAKVRGYQKGRFSFNVKGGRCEVCRGDGIIKIEMHFLPDVYVVCEECKGKRYNRDTLEIKYKGKTINDVLEMTVEEAVLFFENIPRVKRKLQTLYDVGLTYIKLGQSATTLSGGEAQRVKLASELYKRSSGKTMYILDEPTTGLHIDDIARLLRVLKRLNENGDTVIVIEHNLDVIKTADYLIDLGPEGGSGGGTLIAKGTPEEVVNVQESYTGHYLKPILIRDKERTEKPLQ